jgi:hypothetical protein
MSIRTKLLRKALKRFSKSKTTRTIAYKAAKRMSSAQKRALAKAVKASAMKRSSAKLLTLSTKVGSRKSIKVVGGLKGVKALNRKTLKIANTKALRANNRKAIDTLAKAYGSKSQQRAVRKSVNKLLKTTDVRNVKPQELQEYYKKMAKITDVAIKLKKAKVQ